MKAAAPAADAAVKTGPQLSVTVIAVTGAVKAVGGAVTGAVTAVTRGRDPCAGCDLHSACRDRRGRSSLAESPGQRPGPSPLATPEPLAHETLACATEAAIAPGSMSRHVRFEQPSAGLSSAASLST